MSTIPTTGHPPSTPPKKTAVDSTTTTRATLPKTCDEYDSDDADVILLSSDNYQFRVHSYRLQYASPVFRSMISLASSTSQQDPIEFTDKLVECSTVVKRALDIIYTLKVGELVTARARTLLYVIDFAKKWDIEMILELVRTAIQWHFDKGKCSAFELLVLSLSLGDNDLASRALGCKKSDSWKRKPEGQHGICSEPISLNEDYSATLPVSYGCPAATLLAESLPASYGGDIFDLGASPISYFLSVPPVVVWIILRSQHLSTHEKEPVEKHFKRLLDIAYPSTSPTADAIKKRKAEDQGIV